MSDDYMGCLFCSGCHSPNKLNHIIATHEMVESDRSKSKNIPSFKEVADSPIHTILTKENRQKVNLQDSIIPFSR